MRVVGNTYENSVVYGVDPHDRSNGLVFAYNTAYGTKVAHGLIGSREVDSAWWIGNVSFDNAGSGLMIDRDSVSNLIFGNLLFDNRQDGLTFFESSCALVRNSWSISLFRNRVTGNSINAVTAYTGALDQPQRDYALDPYFPVTSLTVADNLLAGRQSLMNLKSVSAVTLGKNRFLGARLISGMDRKVERDLVGLSGRGVTIADQCAPSIPAIHCGLEEAGFVKPVRHFVEPLAGEACGAGGARAHAAVEQDEAKR
jgi:poly(beta-D-mannuronate) C5 epimerase